MLSCDRQQPDAHVENVQCINVNVFVRPVSVCVCVCVCVCICSNVCVNARLLRCLCVNAHLCVCVCVCERACAHVCMGAWHVCVSLRVCVYGRIKKKCGTHKDELDFETINCQLVKHEFGRCGANKGEMWST